MNYKQARGAIPWKPGDEKPEATIRRLRNGEPKGMTMDKIDELIRNIETQAILLHDKSREKSLLMTDYTSSEAARAALRAEFDQFQFINRELKTQLDVEVDLANKRWKKCKRLRKALEEIRDDCKVMGTEYIKNVADAALRGEE